MTSTTLCMTNACDEHCDAGAPALPVERIRAQCERHRSCRVLILPRGADLPLQGREAVPLAAAVRRSACSEKLAQLPWAVRVSLKPSDGTWSRGQQEHWSADTDTSQHCLVPWIIFEGRGSGVTGALQGICISTIGRRRALHTSTHSGGGLHIWSAGMGVIKQHPLRQL